MTTNTHKIDLSTTAMLAQLKISNWTASVMDKRISQDVLTDHGANEKTGRFTKKIINKKGLEKIQSVISTARKFHQKVTLPWGDGTRILPATKFQDYSAEMRQHKADFEIAVNEFTGEYETLKQSAYAELGSMYDETDYPQTNELVDKFSFETEIFPMPNAADFRVELSEEAVNMIRKDIETSTQHAAAKATRSVWMNLHDVVSKMNAKMKAEKGFFKNTLIGNLTELIELLPDLNITNDPDLEAMRVEIKDSLCAYTPEELRKDENKRAEMATSSDKILESMAGYCSPA